MEAHPKAISSVDANVLLPEAQSPDFFARQSKGQREVPHGREDQRRLGLIVEHFSPGPHGGDGDVAEARRWC